MESAMSYETTEGIIWGQKNARQMAGQVSRTHFQEESFKRVTHLNLGIAEYYNPPPVLT